MSRVLAALLLDTLRLTPGSDQSSLAERWAGPGVPAGTRSIAAWIAWEQGEQWLLRRLADSGALPRIPARLATALQIAARRDAKAGMAVDADTAEVIRTIGEKGVPCVLLKGPARRASAASLVLADARLTRDVDVLVPAGEGERLWRHFRSLGYEPYQYDSANLPPGESELQGPSPYHLRTLAREGRAAVELHVSTERGLSPAAAWDRLWSTSRPLSWQGLDVRVPSFTELLWQALMHADVTQPAGWSLRFWLDAASVLAVQPVQWDIVVARLQPMPARERALALRWLAVAIRLAGATAPPSVAAAAPLALDRIVAWRLAVLVAASPTAWRAKLLEEATRTEIGLGLTPLVRGRAWPIHLRRRIGTLAARATYLTWKHLPPGREAVWPSDGAQRRTHPAPER
jgi:hypothetical protein